MKKIFSIFIILMIVAAVVWLGFFQGGNSPAPTASLPDKITYNNSSNELIVVEAPLVGAVTGQEININGQARGTWFFEASFPIELLDKDGKILVQSYAQAQGEWMTENFVPFVAKLQVPASYTGPAVIVLRKDNPSALPEYEASISFPITIN